MGSSLHICRNRNRLGISYIEVLLAAAIFCMLLIPVFPSLSQAVRSAAVARDGYTAHLRAQAILLLVQEAVRKGEPHQPAVEAYAQTWADPMAYGYWLSNGEFYRSPGAPGITVAIHGDELMVTAVVWDTGGRLAGRAAGMINIWSIQD